MFRTALGSLSAGSEKLVLNIRDSGMISFVVRIEELFATLVSICAGVQKQDS
jgi:hypothetical protein